MRRLKKKWKRFFLISGLLVFSSVSAYLLIKTAPRPPEEKVKYARIALSEAVSNRADTYSRNLYREARALYDSAMINWQEENRRFIYFRDFKKVADFADLSAKKAEQAAKVSKNNLIDLSITLKQKISELNQISAQIDVRFDSYPLSTDLWKNISKGKMILGEAGVAYSKGQYADARDKIAECELLLSDAYEKANAHLINYFGNYPEWKKWTDRTIRESRINQGYSIIIDKYSRKCLVYLGGIKKYEYHVELGKNWVGDKRVKGDKCTPEGMYKIIRKFGPGKTKYHKALLIDYPNDADKEQFRQEIARGTLPKHARIGSLIEIHGDGGRGFDWTEGCVALTNQEMDVVFKIAKEGTPVTIVGSMVSLDQLLNEEGI